LIELAYEVAKKKFSSEEETWSDLSVLIFYNNLQVRSQQHLLLCFIAASHWQWKIQVSSHTENEITVFCRASST
jgi:hypothetical protein